MSDFHPTFSATVRSNSRAALISLNSYCTRGSDLEADLLTEVGLFWHSLTRCRRRGNRQERAMPHLRAPCPSANEETRVQIESEQIATPKEQPVTMMVGAMPMCCLS